MEARRWSQLTLAEQLGNIGSEFHRWVKTASDKSFEEVLTLLDMTIADKRWRDKLGELTRLREVVCDLAQGSKLYSTDARTLGNYFLGFGMLARK